MRNQFYSTDRTGEEWSILDLTRAVLSTGGITNGSVPNAMSAARNRQRCSVFVGSGLSARLLPRDLPQWKTFYYYFRQCCDLLWAAKDVCITVESMHQLVRW
ncbi:MAG: hypothetical protein QXS54_07985 [Candidatus Methanomethylicaceae archaeon]